MNTPDHPPRRAPDTSTRTVGIVAHTHWDREWYAPFQEFRIRLVDLLDELLDILEGDRSYRRFMLDGQTAVVDDYLAIRPGNEARIRALVEQGRLSIGPWAILMDEFMVSGETIIRDLQAGLRRASDFGGAMEIGYLPDMFGHIAQMPQILRLAGFEHAVVWRGVPSAVDQTAFTWRSPDGSTIRTAFLYGSYSNGRDIPEDASGLVARAVSYAAELGDAGDADNGDLLLMNGTDHQLPQPWLGRVVGDANALDTPFTFEVTSLSEYLDGRSVSGLSTWDGELRSGARANILMGVASNRVDVHQLAGAAERSLERRAEPLAALLLADDEHPRELLDLAWQKLILNAAHDSSCACSSDEVVEAVRVRYQESRQIADGVARSARRRLAATVDAPRGATIVLNPTARARGGVIEMTVPGSGPFRVAAPDGGVLSTQLLEEVGGESFSTTVTGTKILWVVEAMRGPEFRGTRIRHVETTDADGIFDVVLHAAAPGDDITSLDALRDDLIVRAATDTTFRIRMMRAPAQRLAVSVPTVDGYGWTTLTVDDDSNDSAPADAPGDAVLHGTTLSNDVLSATVDTTDGTVALRTSDDVEVEGAHRLVDGGDGGDTYNYSPPTVDRLIDMPEAVSTTVLEAGPVRARLRVDATYRWPAAAVGDERLCESRTDVEETVRVGTVYELRRGERFLRVHTEFDNRCRDHRLRAHAPLPTTVSGSDAECAFAVVHRGLTPEGGPHEFPLATFPSRRFVDASDGDVGLAVLHDGLLEYEVTDNGTEIALTLLRTTGYLSRLEPSLRPNPAGPPDPLEGPQLQGRVHADYALLPHSGNWGDADLYAAADEFLVPLERVLGGGVEAARSARGQLLEVTGVEVSALTTHDGATVLRVFNPAGTPRDCRIERAGSPVSGDVVNLRGNVVSPFVSPVAVAPGEIVTLRFD